MKRWIGLKIFVSLLCTVLLCACVERSPILKVTRRWYDLFGAAEQNYVIYHDGSVEVTNKALFTEKAMEFKLSDEELASVEAFLEEMPDIPFAEQPADENTETWDYISYDANGNEKVSLRNCTFGEDREELEKIRTVLLAAYNREYKRQYESLTLTVSTFFWSSQNNYDCEVYRNGKVYWEKTTIDGRHFKLQLELPVNDRESLKKLIGKPMSSYRESILAQSVTDGTYYTITNYGMDGNEIGTFSGMILYNDDLEKLMDLITQDSSIFESDAWTEVSE